MTLWRRSVMPESLLVLYVHWARDVDCSHYTGLWLCCAECKWHERKQVYTAHHRNTRSLLITTLWIYSPVNISLVIWIFITCNRVLMACELIIVHKQVMYVRDLALRQMSSVCYNINCAVYQKPVRCDSNFLIKNIVTLRSASALTVFCHWDSCTNDYSIF